jgi:hypothetical protein
MAPILKSKMIVFEFEPSFFSLLNKNPYIQRYASTWGCSYPIQLLAQAIASVELSNPYIRYIAIF